ncbi:MAG: hypothetical protein ABSB70_02475 [Candidatus Velthaea sp.]|jgi:hypothetical protein
MTQENDALDRVFAADRNTGSTPPETQAESSNVVGRPGGADEAAGFREPTETPAVEREAFSGEEAIREGASFDGLGLPVAEGAGTSDR